MKEIVSGVVIETEYERVTLGAIQTPNGVIMIDAPISMKDAQIWRSSCSSVPSACPVSTHVFNSSSMVKELMLLEPEEERNRNPPNQVNGLKIR